MRRKSRLNCVPRGNPLRFEGFPGVVAQAVCLPHGTSWEGVDSIPEPVLDFSNNSEENSTVLLQSLAVSMAKEDLALKMAEFENKSLKLGDLLILRLQIALQEMRLSLRNLQPPWPASSSR